MINRLMNVVEVIKLIEESSNLILAGDEKVLLLLPKGNWIGGTIPYFMGENGGEINRDQIYVTKLPEYITNATIKKYNSDNIETIYDDAPDNGFSFIILPIGCKTYTTFALNSNTYSNFAIKPLVGWVSGAHLDEIDYVKPMVFNGTNGEKIDDGAVVFSIELPEDRVSEIQIINGFKQGDGDTITFEEDTFVIEDASINGEKVNFAKYLTDNNIDTGLPLITNMYGTDINTSIKELDNDSGVVTLYAPVFTGLQYKIARPVDNYITNFIENVPKIYDNEEILFSCNCLLNYSLAKLEGKKVGDFTGPITYGEIAYQFLNRTFVFISISTLK